MARSIDVVADLLLTVDGADIPIRGTGDRIVVDLPDLRTGRRMLESGPFAAQERSAGVTRAHELLSAGGITLDVCLNGRVLARIGKEARPSAVARFLNLGDVEVRPTESVRAVARRRPGVVIGLVAGAAVLGGLIWYWRSRD